MYSMEQLQNKIFIEQNSDSNLNKLRDVNQSNPDYLWERQFNYINSSNINPTENMDVIYPLCKSKVNEFKPNDVSDITNLNLVENLQNTSFDDSLLIKNNLFDNDLLFEKNKFNIMCSQKKKNINWGDYRTPPRQVAGQGFGNPEHYERTYIGLDSRTLTGFNHVRDTDISDKQIIPLDSFYRNFVDVKYENDSRSGVSTRTYEKNMLKFDSNNKR